MDKVTSRYEIDGQIYRLIDPEHFYEFLSHQTVSASLEDELRRYRAKYPAKLRLWSYPPPDIERYVALTEEGRPSAGDSR